MIDDMNDNKPSSARETIPRVNGAVEEVNLLDRTSSNDGEIRVPMHVLFNQAARICTRWNKTIKGTQMQRSFVQRIVSTIYGYSFPILFFHAMLFPKHFWCNSRHDRTATLGCAPISCFRKATYPDGFASTLDQARTYATHASSSTSTDDNFTLHCYGIQANAASRGLDSRLAIRTGFSVCTTSTSGLKLGESDKSQLNENLDSGQGAMNLSAAAHKLGCDAFITYTPNQKDHPGLRHLHDWKESRRWTSNIERYDSYPPTMQRDFDMSMEMAYTHTMTRCWLEVRKLWLQFIISSTTTKMGKVSHAFFRDEYQECSGNLCHIHGLIGFDRGNMDDEEFKEFVCSLQRNSVGDLVAADEVQGFIDSGLFKNEHDWVTCRAKAETVLSHTMHNSRCLRRVDYTGVYDKDFVCRKLHPVFDSKDCKVDEFHDLPFSFSEACLRILESIGLYTPPVPGEANGTFHHEILQPKRHLGAVHPQARENMSPVMSEHFAFTLSMQNMQVITGTNGVTRYVVKVRMHLSDF